MRRSWQLKAAAQLLAATQDLFLHLIQLRVEIFVLLGAGDVKS